LYFEGIVALLGVVGRRFDSELFLLQQTHTTHTQ